MFQRLLENAPRPIVCNSSRTHSRRVIWSPVAKSGWRTAPPSSAQESASRRAASIGCSSRRSSSATTSSRRARTERLLDANRTIGQPDKITVIFGRKITKHYRGKLQTEIEDMNLPNPVIRSH
jgi:hypothetical protein